MKLSKIEKKIGRANNFLLIPHVLHTNRKIINSEYVGLHKERVIQFQKVSNKYFHETLYNRIHIMIYGLTKWHTFGLYWNNGKAAIIITSGD